MSDRSHPDSNRRQFLSDALTNGVLLGGGLGFLSQLRPVSAEEAKLSPTRVREGNGVEGTVRLLEQTPRKDLLEVVAARVKSGLSYQELLAALMLAGVRNVQPRPSVGFKFHAVLVINSAHLASLASPDSDRWLPIFWALDRFKASQLETEQSSGWKMSPVDEGKVPPAHKAREAFVAAMDRWDEPAADAAAAALARTAGRNECFELFCRYGARDFRDIGHKAIYVANSFRTLECVGWHHAEPVLRSLAYALLKFDGGNPADTDQPADRPWRRNLEIARDIPTGWQAGKTDAAIATGLLDTFRTADDKQAAEAVRDALKAGASAQVAWDAVMSSASEVLMRKRGIVALHSVTTANALHYAYQASGDAQSRLMMLLQAASFLTLFRDAAKVTNGPEQIRVDQFEPDQPPADPNAALDAIFADTGGNRARAASRALAYLDGPGRADDLMHAARRIVFLKGTDSHDYKFSSAVLENYGHLSAACRNRFLAASMFYFPGSGTKDNELVKRTRAALG